MDVDQLAQIIRKVDGENKLGAGALAEAILASLPPAPGAARAVEHALNRSRAALESAISSLDEAELRETRKSRKGWKKSTSEECQRAVEKIDIALESVMPSASTQAETDPLKESNDVLYHRYDQMAIRAKDAESALKEALSREAVTSRHLDETLAVLGQRVTRRDTSTGEALFWGDDDGDCLSPAIAITVALEAYGATKVREGMQKASEKALHTLRNRGFAGPDIQAVRAAILAAMQKGGGQ